MQKFKKIISCVMAVTAILGGTMNINAVNENENQNKKEIVYAHELDQYAYNGSDLGANYSKEQTVFKVWAPKASGIAVKLYSTGSSEEEGAQDLSTTLMKKGQNGVWTATVKGDKKNLYYTYLITNDGVTIETADVYSKAVGVNGNRSMIVDLASTNPEGWDKDSHVLYDNPNDAVVWEIHVRDFSSGEISGVSVKHKGKYLAFAETGTTLDGKGEVSTCIDYLKKLGVTHVQLMPVYDYATVDERNTDSDEYNWGYDPKNYNVPEGSYSTDPYHGEVRINEFKQMVQALHNAGIGVIMDVVYNHTYTAKGSCFENTVPGYYFRLKEDGSLSDASGCGNETASDHLMYRKYMIDSILYWTNEYHIDGFRFDLMGIHDVQTMNEIRNALDTKVKDGKKIIMYGEPWTADAVATKEKTCVKDNVKLLNSRVGAFNDSLRDAVKGHVFNAAETGFVQDGSNIPQLKDGIRANIEGTGNAWFNAPSQSVAYISAHDNYTLYDKLVLSSKQDESFDKRDNTIVDMNKLAAAITLTSQGIAFMQAGEEFARTKYGDENSYVSPDSINSLNWQNLVTYSDLNSYYQGLIELRKNFKPFRDPSSASAKSITFSDTTDGVVAYTLENKLSKENEWAYIAAAFNASDQEKEVELLAADGSALPTEWVIIANKEEAGLRSLGSVSGSKIKIAPKSALILADKASFDKLKLQSQNCTVRTEYRDENTGELLYARVIKGKENENYKIENLDESMNLFYDFSKIEGEAEGKFSKEPITIICYYKKFNGVISSLTVNYMRENNSLLGTSSSMMASSIVLKMREGEEYTAPMKEISGMTLDLDMFPTNAVGRMGMNDITVNYYYQSLGATDLIIHYHNENHWNQIGAYIYYKDENDYSVNEITKSVPGTEMQADTQLGQDWQTLVIKDKGNLANLFVRFYNLENPDDFTGEYRVNREVWIDRNGVTGTGELHTIYVHSNGKLLDSFTEYGKTGTNYHTVEKVFDGLVLSGTTSNLKGEYTNTPIYVIYSYEEQSIIERPVTKAALALAISGTVMMGAAILLGISYFRRKKKMLLY